MISPCFKAARVLLPGLSIVALSLTIDIAHAVPEAVTAAFAKQYPDATAPVWELDTNGYWEAGFEESGKELRGDYDEDGTWIETEESIEFSALPDAVQSAIRREFGDEEISEIESVDSARKGAFYDVEFTRSGKNRDVEYRADGRKISLVTDPIESARDAMLEPIPELNGEIQKANEIGRITLLFEFGVNLFFILLFAYVIYYRRHHNHKMLFLLLGFNLFLFPIFLLNSVLTAGFGFTIFALLALVRLRSENFDKAEVAYLLGAVALTFVNAVLPASVDYIASVLIVTTAYFGDHPRLWRDAYRTVQIRLPMGEMRDMLDPSALMEKVETEFGVEVNDIEIERVEKKQVRLRVMYREIPEKRKAHAKKAGLGWRN